MILRQILDAAFAQVLHGGTNLLERHPGVEQALHDTQHEDVSETVQSLGAGSGSGAHRRLDQSRARPIVELTIGDSCGLARRRPAVPRVLVDRGQAVAEQHALVACRDVSVRHDLSFTFDLNVRVSSPPIQRPRDFTLPRVAPCRAAHPPSTPNRGAVPRTAPPRPPRASRSRHAPNPDRRACAKVRRPPMRPRLHGAPRARAPAARARQPPPRGTAPPRQISGTAAAPQEARETLELHEPFVGEGQRSPRASSPQVAPHRRWRPASCEPSPAAANDKGSCASPASSASRRSLMTLRGAYASRCCRRHVANPFHIGMRVLPVSRRCAARGHEFLSIEKPQLGRRQARETPRARPQARRPRASVGSCDNWCGHVVRVTRSTRSDGSGDAGSLIIST